MIRHAFPSLIITFCIPSTPNIRQTNIPKPIGHNKYAQYRYPSYIPKIGSKANNKYINCHTEWQNTERRFMECCWILYVLLRCRYLLSILFNGSLNLAIVLPARISSRNHH